MIHQIDPTLKVSDRYIRKAHKEGKLTEAQAEQLISTDIDLHSETIKATLDGEDALPKGFNKLYFFNGRTITELEFIPQGESPFLVGKADTCDLKLRDPKAENEHIAINLIDDVLYFQNRGRNNNCTFNGERMMMSTCTLYDRMIINFGVNWLIYDGRPEDEKDLYDNELPSFQLLNQEPFIEKFSNFLPILIGKHPICDIVLEDKKVKDVHAVAYWSSQGINATATVGNTSVNGVPSMGAKDLNSGDVINIGDFEVHTMLHGKVLETIREYFPPLEENPDLGLSVISGPAAGARAKLEHGVSFTVGCAPESINMEETMSFDPDAGADFPIPDSSIDTVHASVRVRHNSIGIDNISANKKPVLVNGKEITRARCAAGDVLQLGECKIFFYYRM